MAVTKSLEQERAVGEYEKQSCLFRLDRTQCTIGSALPNDPLAYRIQHLASRERFPYNAERLKTTLIRSAADLDTPGRIGHALADGELCGHELAMSGRFSPNVESARIVDCRLDPQHAALFVVHFDRVFFGPMFYADALWAAFQVAPHLAVEVSMVSSA